MSAVLITADQVHNYSLMYVAKLAIVSPLLHCHCQHLYKPDLLHVDTTYKTSMNSYLFVNIVTAYQTQERV